MPDDLGTGCSESFQKQVAKHVAYSHTVKFLLEWTKLHGWEYRSVLLFDVRCLSRSRRAGQQHQNHRIPGNNEVGTNAPTVISAYSKQRQNLMKKVAQLYMDYMGKKHVKTTLSVDPALGKALEAGSYEEMGNGTEGCSTWCAWAWP